MVLTTTRFLRVHSHVHSTEPVHIRFRSPSTLQLIYLQLAVMQGTTTPLAPVHCIVDITPFGIMACLLPLIPPIIALSIAVSQTSTTTVCTDTTQKTSLSKGVSLTV